MTGSVRHGRFGLLATAGAATQALLLCPGSAFAKILQAHWQCFGPLRSSAIATMALQSAGVYAKGTGSEPPGRFWRLMRQGMA